MIRLSSLLTIPVIILLLFIQMVVSPTIKLANGHADLVLVFIVAWALQERGQPVWLWTLLLGYIINTVSGVPLYIYPVTYIFVTALAKFIKRMTWQMPVLAMLFTVLVGSLIELGGSYIALSFADYDLPFTTSLNSVILPSTVLNLMLCIPVYLLVSDFYSFLQPQLETS